MQNTKLPKQENPSTSGDLTDGQNLDLCLEIISGQHQGERFVISNKTILGSEAAQIELSDEDIAPTHCVFRLQQNVLSVSDSGSAKGTFVNGKRLRPKQMALLELGDKVRFGFVEGVIALASTNENEEVAPNLPETPLAASSSTPGIWQKFQGLFSKKKETNDAETSNADENAEDDDNGFSSSFTLANEEAGEKTSVMILRAKEAMKVELKQKKASSSKTEVFQSEKMAQSKMDSIVTGFFPRILSVAGDAALAIIFYELIEDLPLFVLVSNDVQMKVHDALAPMMAQELPKLLIEHLLTAVPCVLVYVLIRILGALAIGVSPFQFLIGLRGGRGKVIKRIGGCLREIVGVVTAPFILFDLPCIFNRPTVKELITGTRLKTVKKWQLFLVPVFLLPLLVVISLISPFFKKMELLQGIFVEQMEVKRNKDLKTAQDNTKNIIYSSRHFAFNNTLPSENPYILIPSFTLEKVGTTTVASPLMLVYERQQKLYASVRAVKRFNVLDFAQVARASDPLFVFNYPALNDSLLIKEKAGTLAAPIKRKKNNKNNKNLSALDNQTQKEMRILVENAFSLNLSRIPEYIMTYGPFLKGIVNFRDKLINDLGISGPTTNVTLGRLGNLDFYLFMPKDFRTRVKDDEKTCVTGLPLDVAYPILYEFCWMRPKNPVTPVHTEFLFHFFQNVDWSLDNLPAIKEGFDSGENEVSEMNILDQFAKKDLPPEKRSQLENAVYEYFLKLGGIALRDDDEELRQLLVSVSGNYRDIIKLSKLGSEDFLSRVQLLGKALEEKQKEFFGQPALPGALPPEDKNKENDKVSNKGSI